jgi:hypothetical protein
MRLRTALEASRHLGEPILYWWDAASAEWITTADVGIVGTPNPHPAPSRGETSRSVKRAIFPSTLFESGRQAVRAFSPAVIPRGATVVLHTSYLAPLGDLLRAAGANRIVVDVYDFVAYAHLDDAIGAAALRPIREVYGISVRRRESDYLARADCLPVAGWRDTELLNKQGLHNATWIPTGIPPLDSTMPESGVIHVGLIGNFAHSATASAAAALLASPLVTAADCRLVFAGLHADRLPVATEITVLGAVSDVRTFYDRIHAVVVPVQNSAGMKCKLAEGMLAGKTVLTTPQGIAGFPPSLADHLVVTSFAEINSETVKRAIEQHDPAAGRLAFEERCGLPAAVESYVRLLEACILSYDTDR